MKTKMLLLLTLVLSVSFVTNAQSSYKSKTQNESKRPGYKYGELKPAEARRLAYQQKYIRRDMRKSKCSGGHLSRAEKARIMQEHQMAGRYMYRFNNYKRNKF